MRLMLPGSAINPGWSGLSLTTIMILAVPLTSYAANTQEKALVFEGCSIIRRAFMAEADQAYHRTTGQTIDFSSRVLFFRHSAEVWGSEDASMTIGDNYSWVIRALPTGNQ